jgi:CDP-2,3-bis-(O-geranylgeranyl)-sn-glycerol synthase
MPAHSINTPPHDVRRFNRRSRQTEVMSGIFEEVVSYDGAKQFLLVVVTLAWLYMAGYLANTFAMLWGKWIPALTGMPVKRIDAGKLHSDGNRLLGDGKTWNGFIGGSMTAGLLTMLQHHLTKGQVLAGDRPAVDLLAGVSEEAWFWVGGAYGAAFVLGCVLGFGTMTGDAVGSFIKRRRGMKREGDVSSKAPLLDTLPFIILLYAFGLLLLGDALHGQRAFILPMLATLIATPMVHRLFNLVGYKLGLKSVPY